MERRRAGRKGAMSKLLMNKKDPLSYATEEAINRLRINMTFLGHEVRKIMVVSSTENEGKSFVAMNLWRQMAESGVHCALLDADLRKSVMKEKYEMTVEGGEQLHGTSHVLSGEMPLLEAIYQTEMERGDILPNVENVVNPTMLLEGRKFRDILDEMGKEYRYIFVDAPPLGMVSDGEKIGSMCDGAIFVVRSGKTTKSQVRNALRLLERAGCPLLGVVLNRVGATSKDYYYKKNYDYYYKK
jgi:capsular exopolysaccharide synthesis family protein